MNDNSFSPPYLTEGHHGELQTTQSTEGFEMRPPVIVRRVFERYEVRISVGPLNNLYDVLE
jgi:hypothetical protein